MRATTTTLIVAALSLAVNGAGASASPDRGGVGSSHRCGHVYWRSVRNGDQICPQTHSVLADVAWIKLRWTRWGRSEAVGHGLQVHYYTGTQIDMRNPIRIRLSRSVQCADGRTIYSQIHVVEYSSNHRRVIHRYAWSYACDPRLTSSGEGGGGG